jgi:hypothetical protein
MSALLTRAKRSHADYGESLTYMHAGIYLVPLATCNVLTVAQCVELWLRCTSDAYMFASHSLGPLLLIVVYNVSSVLGPYTHMLAYLLTCMLYRTYTCARSQHVSAYTGTYLLFLPCIFSNRQESVVQGLKP